ncbi:hypothetical protein EDD80_1259 [Anseongella ginsenosidimutans]|uniref:Uncharacterized protein n=1 Tax=Anseongella ginsenosidimutans TaxID=496056 RepID=A0A4R3KLZ0_9SPHI|nr:hypothetical protein [Anseongella ginsenosidimutans]QEC53624.1 hypothetical protein FRZ59_15625 [Anseongella ginsenosidimutans]TCS83918.1 hypothetical protein EDD80_1259 [Anseongella ginsenosidimutans]
MSTINAQNISGNIVQIGETNTIKGASFIDEHEEELLRLINEHCPTPVEKAKLVSSLQSIKEGDQNSSSSAKLLTNFLERIGSGVISGSILYGLKQFLENS